MPWGKGVRKDMDGRHKWVNILSDVRGGLLHTNAGDVEVGQWLADIQSLPSEALELVANRNIRAITYEHSQPLQPCEEAQHNIATKFYANFTTSKIKVH